MSDERGERYHYRLAGRSHITYVPTQIQPSSCKSAKIGNFDSSNSTKRQQRTVFLRQPRVIKPPPYRSHTYLRDLGMARV
jgi:hypothetical protein